MRKMKDSGIEWIGQIPQEWGTIRAKYVTTITNGSDPKTEGNIPVYGSGSGCFKTCGEHKEGPTVLLGRKGTVDIPQYVTGNYWNVDTAFDVKPQDDRLDLEFYYFASTCFDYKFYTATTTLPSMTQTNYGNMYIPFPSVDEQRRIVTGLKEKLEGIDALIAAKEKTNALLKERRQSIIYEAVTKGLNPDAPMKDSGIEWIGQIPQSWDIGRVKHFYNVTLGKMLQPAQKAEDDELCSYMCAANIKWSGVDASIEKKMWFSPKEKEAYKLKAGDLLVTEGGDVAVSCIWNNEVPECYIQNAVHRVRPKNDWSNRYLYYWLSTLKATGYIDQVCNKATLAHFTKDKFDSCIIPVVNGVEQNQIVDYLDLRCEEMDELILANEATIQKLKEYRQSIIYEAVTGKIEV